MNIADLIAQENFAEGPFAHSGGVIHKVTPAVAQLVAIKIALASRAFSIRVPIICAFIRGEGNFDPDSFDPNLQDSPTHSWPSPEIAAQHTDYGLCQINGDPSCLGINGVARSLNIMCQKIINNTMDISLIGNYPREVALEAYNAGVDGAIAKFKAGGVKACDYGHTVAERIDEYVKLGVI